MYLSTINWRVANLYPRGGRSLDRQARASHGDTSNFVLVSRIANAGRRAWASSATVAADSSRQAACDLRAGGRAICWKYGIAIDSNMRQCKREHRAGVSRLRQRPDSRRASELALIVTAGCDVTATARRAAASSSAISTLELSRHSGTCSRCRDLGQWHTYRRLRYRAGRSGRAARCAGRDASRRDTGAPPQHHGSRSASTGAPTAARPVGRAF